MGMFNTLGTTLRERRRTIAATLAFVGIAAGIFLAGTWAGSSGAFTLGPVTDVASHARNAPPPNVSKSDDGCSDKPMPHDTMGPSMPMPSDKAGPGMSSDKMCGDMPRGKMGMGDMPMGKMPMDKPMRDKMCCDKK